MLSQGVSKGENSEALLFGMQVGSVRVGSKECAYSVWALSAAVCSVSEQVPKAEGWEIVGAECDVVGQPPLPSYLYKARVAQPAGGLFTGKASRSF